MNFTPDPHGFGEVTVRMKILIMSMCLVRMSGNPGSDFARRRSTFSSAQGMFATDLPQEFAQGVDLGADETIHDPLMEDADPFTAEHAAEGPSSSKGKKGRGRNLKGLQLPASRDDRKWIKLTPDKLQFADPTIPRAITSLWKSSFDGPYFTYERVPHNKVMEIYNKFKALYQWHPADDRHIRQAFLNSMKHRWSDNIRVERLRWEEDPNYVPCWIPDHVWSQMQEYWKSDKFQMLSERGAKNRNSGKRVTHTTGSVSFGIHEMRMTKARGGVQPPHQEKYKETHTFRKKVPKGQEPTWINEKAKHRHDTYVASCVESHGPDANLWPQMDNQAWGIAVGGCSSNFMPGIGSQVNPEDVGFTYRRRQPQDNLMTSMMISNFNEEQARQHEELERQHQQMALIQQQLVQMTEAQNNMSQTIANSVAVALAAYGIRPQAGHYPFAPPQPPLSQGSGLRPYAAFGRSFDSSETSPVLPDYQQQLPQQDGGYHPIFYPNYQPH